MWAGCQSAACGGPIGNRPHVDNVPHNPKPWDFSTLFERAAGPFQDTKMTASDGKFLHKSTNRKI
jgi:hypothetical protein